MRINPKHMNLVFTLVIGLAVTWITACRTKPIHESNSITLDPFSNRIPEINSSQLIKSIRFIPLETTAENILGSISKLIKTKDRYYILDGKIGRKVYVFDIKGNYLFSFGESGRGPQEYINPTDITIDEKEGAIYLLDNGQKIIKTDLNGKFILEKQAPQEYNRIQNIVAHDGFVYATSGQQYGTEKQFQILQSDRQLNPIEYFLPYEYPFPATLHFANRLYVFNNNINFVSVFENKTYSKSANGFSERYIFDVGNKGLQLADLTPDKFVLNSEGIYLFSYCIEGDSLIHLPIFLNGRPRFGLIDKASNRYFTIDRIIDDTYSMPAPISFYEGWYIGTMSSLQFAREFPNSNINPKEDDNPVLIEYQLSFRAK